MYKLCCTTNYNFVIVSRRTRDDSVRIKSGAFASTNLPSRNNHSSSSSSRRELGCQTFVVFVFFVKILFFVVLVFVVLIWCYNCTIIFVQVIATWAINSTQSALVDKSNLKRNHNNSDNNNTKKPTWSIC